MGRKQLVQRHGQRLKFRGIYDSPGASVGWNSRVVGSIKLTHIIDVATNEQVLSKIRFNRTRGIVKLGILSKGDQIEFVARVVCKVKKGCENKKRNTYYTLERPTQFVRIQEAYSN